MSYKVVDLFCGGGGFSEGFHQAGFEIVRAFDIWEPALLTHNKNHPSNVEPIAIKYDIYELSILPDEEFEKIVPDTEIIIGSPPCVAFSNSNRSGKADKTLGILLLKSYLRIVARKKFKKNSMLKYWILENVKNIKNYIQESYTMEELGLTGDEVLHINLNSSGIYNVKYYGVPSNRERFICGEFPAPKKTLDKDFVTLKTVKTSLGLPKDKKEVVITDPNYDFKMLGNEVTDHHYIKEIPEFEWSKAKRQKLDKGYMGKMSFPENEEKPSRTIMATMSASSRESMIFPYKNGRYRYPTIRELATCMSFPIDYRFYGESDSVKYKLVGNAVPPKFSFALADAIRQQDHLTISNTFKRKTFFDDDFYNLNGVNFEDKKEKPKREKARFKYHVPYLIINRFRTELQNYESHDGKILWKTEIHKGQGKDAKVYSNFKAQISFLDQKRRDVLEKFIEDMALKIKTMGNLQFVYCQVTEYRKEQKCIGPDELLVEIRNLNDHFFSKNVENQWVEELQIEIPEPILITYYTLNEILNRIDT
ncbi:DNA cytosine methyltransferase [Enterococcus faecalis]|jgi:DNA (cytosine-5)-methyltransferase 1|uniref:DNA cytosine methyltransferase n=1 Tax=Enterococcus faecalis TaxID=1351 RepID=UPI000CF14961|nr:DNA cytosine methyltransferase [Enterococcus faecalis]EHL2501961.1 DNA cytosine methyltransferase [Enterococcus faecalis]MDD0850435.1 DNA cytosine methyltransferase [Enterococcus faecalis]MEB6094431.1 DNA cytosine methyltransferase [Enterococcus faecalis]PQB32350.1 DNA cytosine methyltransferase [Enterococcus faecalis]PQB48018.1 DNA cytosine methyltransferase [Enterococcus faecalis]